MDTIVKFSGSEDPNLHDYPIPAQGSPLDVLAQQMNGNFVVVEREDDLFVGTAEYTDGLLVIRTGNQGRPAVLTMEDVDAYKIVHKEAFSTLTEVDADADLTPVYAA